MPGRTCPSLTVKLLLFLTLLALPLSATTTISSCPATLGAAGETYVLNQSIASSGQTCLTVTAASVTINCNGFTISATNTGYYTVGIYSTASNTIIKNCIIVNKADYGILFYGAANGAISNSTITTTGGILRVGIRLASSSNYNTLSNLTLTATNGESIELASSSFNTLANLTATSSTGSSIYLSSSSNNTLTNITATSTDGVGIYLYSSSNYNTLTNLTINASNYGIYIRSSSNYNTLSNLTATSTSASGRAIYLQSSSINNTLANLTATATSSSGYGIYIDSSSTYNIFSNVSNSIDDPGTGAKFYSDSTQNTLRSYNNTGYWPLLASNGKANCSANSCLAWYNGSAGGRSWSGSEWVDEPNNRYWYNNQEKETFGCSYQLQNNTAYSLDHNIPGWSGSSCFGLTGLTNVTIDCQGNSIGGTPGGGYSAFYLSGVTNSTITNCSITGFDYGIRIASSSGNNITNNTFQGAEDIYFSPSNISGCINTFANNTGTGGNPILYYSGTNALISDMATSNIILCNASNSNITNVTSRGISLLYSNNSQISNLTATSTSGYAIYLQSSSYNTLSNITATSNSSHGIYLSSSSNNNITNSAATSTDGYGIYLNSSSSNTLANLTATSNSGAGINISSSSSTAVSNSTITSGSSIGIYMSGTCSNDAFSNNTITAGDFAVFLPGGKFTSYSGEVFLGNTLRGNHWVSSSSGNPKAVFNSSSSGNTYYFANGSGAWTAFDITDTDGDGWADSGTARPFSAATVGSSYWPSSGEDWFPGIPLNAAPTISIASPASTTYPSTTIGLDFSTSTYRNISSCWYSLNRGANTTITGCANTTITASTGANTLLLYANDTVGNTGASSTVAFVVNTGGGASEANSSNFTVNSSTTQVVVPANITLRQITIPSSVPSTTAVFVLFGSRINTSESNQTTLFLNASLNITRDTGTGPYTLQFPENITITGPSNWTGEIQLPTVKPSSSVSITNNERITTLAVSQVIELGFAGSSLTFNRAVRLLFPLEAGKLVGYSTAGGTVTPIGTACTADDQATIDAQLSSGECKISSGSDLVVWTKHFTTFATYTQTIVQYSPGAIGNNNGGGSLVYIPAPANENQANKTAVQQNETRAQLNQSGNVTGIQQNGTQWQPPKKIGPVEIPEITPETVQQVKEGAPVSLAVTMLIGAGVLAVALAVAMLAFRARKK